MEYSLCDFRAIFKITEKNMPPFGHSYGERAVECFELDYIYDTRGGIIITNGVEQPLKNGMLFFRTPGMLTEGICPYCCFLLRFHAEISPSWIPSIIEMANSEYISMLFERIYQAYLQQDISFDYLFDVTINEIFLQIFLNIQKNQLNSNQDGTFAEIISYIDNNYKEPITLLSLSNLAGYSKYHFSHIFKQQYGQSPINYLNKKRLIAACKFLIETNQDLRGIMDRCGITDQVNFHRKFKDYTKMTPTQYRNRNRIA